MDTRRKILTPAQYHERLTGPREPVVSGYFDPLLAAHARRLSELAGEAQVIVALADPPAPILDTRARAELAAALSAVRCVVLPNEDGSCAVEASCDEREADLRRREDLAARVHGKHTGAASKP